MENIATPIKRFNQTQLKYLPKNLLCLSHLRWDFVFQRPQQLLTRLAKTFNIYFLEEPVFDAQDRAYLTLGNIQKNLSVLVPHLPPGLSAAAQIEMQKDLLDRLLAAQNLADFAFWYYTPMALAYSDHLHPKMIIYDCMDELSAFKFAPENLPELEKKLFKIADLVFTGGESLFQAKKDFHGNIYAFPSSIEQAHFAQARSKKYKTAAPKGIKLGYYGVIDERFDIGLIEKMADLKPEWQFMLIGPVVKIDPESLPQRKNIHYLGSKNYTELPAYLSTWDVALIPFLINESTRFISPTKTPEYLASGRPVISTPIRDVVHPYGIKKLVKIAKTAPEFISAAEELLSRSATTQKAWLKSADQFLAQNSWELTCAKMQDKIAETLEEKLISSVA